MNEFLNNLSSKEWFITLVTFLTANFASIFTMVILLIKEKIKANRLSQNVTEILAKAGIQLNQENLNKLNEMNEKIESKLNDCVELIYQKLKIDTEEKKAEVEAKTQELNALLESSINLDDVE